SVNCERSISSGAYWRRSAVCNSHAAWSLRDHRQTQAVVGQCDSRRSSFEGIRTVRRCRAEVAPNARNWRRTKRRGKVAANGETGRRKPLFFDHFFEQLNEVGRLARGAQFGGFLVGVFAFVVLELYDRLHRLVVDGPKGFEANFLGCFRAAFAFS